jgi:mersacidin/lichenicidin family type 2 lantibiotic
MSILDIIRAWQDPEYRNSLSSAERAMLPANPVGEIELTEGELTEVIGAAQSGNSEGCNSKFCSTAECCTFDCKGNSHHPCTNCP